MFDANHSKLVKSYADIHHRSLRAMGLWIEKEDLEGEFFLILAKAYKMFRDSDGRNAKFETYVISAINNRFLDIRNKLIYDAKCGAAHRPTEQGSGLYGIQTVDVVSTIKEVFASLSAKEREVMRELISPTEEIVERIPDGCSQRVYLGKVQRAISEVHGYSYTEVKNMVKKIRGKVKKSLAYCQKIK